MTKIRKQNVELILFDFNSIHFRTKTNSFKVVISQIANLILKNGSQIFRSVWNVTLGHFVGLT